MQPFLKVLLRRTADTNERLIAIARVGFTLTVLGRFVVVNGDASARARAAIEFPAAGLILLVSTWVLYFSRRRSLFFAERLVSVLADSTLSFALLVTNVLWPWPSYQGVLRTPDAAALLVVTLAAGFRLSTRLALVGGCLNMGFVLLLFGLDLTLGDRTLVDPWQTLVLSLILLGACVTLAVLVAVRSQSLVQTAARQAEARSRAIERLDVLLQTQHDLRSLVASATLSSGLLRESLEQHTPQALEISKELERDLGDLSDFINERHAALSARRPLASLEVDEALALMKDAARHVAGLTVIWPHVSGERFFVAGGRAAFFRVMLNLLVNARDGDGHSGGQTCTVTFEAAADAVWFHLDDDGPGFPLELLAERPVMGQTTKGEGSGLGLVLVTWVVEDSGGEVLKANRAGRGARVSLRFLKEKLPEVTSANFLASRELG